MLYGFHKENEKWADKAFAMLMRWKERDGSDALYQVLHDALCHESVHRKDLAEEFCVDHFSVKGNWSIHQHANSPIAGYCTVLTTLQHSCRSQTDCYFTSTF